MSRTTITQFRTLAGRPDCFHIRDEHNNVRPDEWVALSHGELMSSILELHGVIASVEDCSEFVFKHLYPNGEG